MTDVRLTALNPEDSQAYPVACNSSGELLVSQGVESDKYVEKSGDNMTGDLTLGTDKISLKAANGSATFSGDIDLTDSRFFLYSQTTNGNSKTFQLFSDIGGTKTEKVSLTAGGAATFSGTGIFGGDADNGANAGIRLASAGAIAACRTAGNSAVFTGYTRGNSTPQMSLYADGSAWHASDIGVGGASIVSPKISLNADGSANFAGDVVIGSRNKSWMIVEQSGLAHLVEQVTFDRKAYPKLRDIPGELDLVEKALSEVMEKLRLVPPAGWPVWDGSDET